MLIGTIIGGPDEAKPDFALERLVPKLLALEREGFDFKPAGAPLVKVKAMTFMLVADEPATSKV
jgi:hypothetical protein